MLLSSTNDSWIQERKSLALITRITISRTIVTFDELYLPKIGMFVMLYFDKTIFSWV